MFDGSVALVTGAGSGLGQMAAWRLASDGAAVAAVDVDAHGLSVTAARAPSVRPWICDVTDGLAVASVVQQVEAELGPIGRVVSAAGVVSVGELLAQPVSEIRRVMEVNYAGSVEVLHAIVPGMVERGRGDVVQFASIAGWVPTPHLGAYTASKFAVAAFVEVLAHENRHSGVRFVCVCPPAVRTPMLDRIKRAGVADLFERARPLDPDDVLRAVEAGLEAGRLFVFPGFGTSLLWRVRRFAPAFLWRRIHSATGGVNVSALPGGPAYQAEPPGETQIQAGLSDIGT
jgi:short-subunit dehydrogenase